MNSNRKKITLSVDAPSLKIIDDEVAKIPFVDRSKFMVDCTLQVIFNTQSLPSEVKNHILPHIAELSNLINQLGDGALKDSMKQEAMEIWRCLK